MLCQYIDERLHLDGIDIGDIAAQFGTPCYVYSRGAIEARWREYDTAFGARAHRVCYAVKANDNLSILQTLQRIGAGFDIVSGGELERVLAAGASAEDVVFSGVGKTRVEIERAVTQAVGCINLESAAELERVAECAERAGRCMDVAVRVNPDVDAGTHPYISTGLKENKFGVPIAEAMALYRRIAELPAVRARGIACHIGSQLTTIAPVVDAVREVVAMAAALADAGIELEHIDVGGGLGICYRDERPPTVARLVGALLEVVPPQYTVVMEPGRSIVGAAGLLLTRVEYVKHNGARNFIIVDAAMNDLMRPALYQAYHDVRNYRRSDASGALLSDVVGPICESGDWLARERKLAVSAGELLAIMTTGAYGFAMASNYNSRPRAAEVLVETGSYRLIRARETLDQLLANERALLERG